MSTLCVFRSSVFILCAICIPLHALSSTSGRNRKSIHKTDSRVTGKEQRTVPGYYHGVNETVQLQRFVIPAGAKVDSITIGLDGIAADTAGYLVLYDHSGGRISPLRSEQRTRFAIAKDSAGYHRVTIPLNYIHKSGQLFIGVTHLRKGVELITDAAIRDTQCVWNGVPWNDQVRLEMDSVASVLPFAFDIAVHYAPPARYSHGVFVKDTTVDNSRRRNDFDMKHNIVVVNDNDNQISDIVCNGILQVDAGTGRVYDILDGRNFSPRYTASLPRTKNNGLSIYTFGVTSSGANALLNTRIRHTDDIAFENTYVNIQLPTLPLCHVLVDGNADGIQDLMYVTKEGFYLGVRDQHDALTVHEMVSDNVRDYPVSLVVAATSPTESVLIGRTADGSVITYIIDKGAVSVRDVRRIDKPLSHSTGIALHQTTESAKLLTPGYISDIEIIGAQNPRNDIYSSTFLLADLDGDLSDELICTSGRQCGFVSVWKRYGSDWVDVTYEYGLEGVDDCQDVILEDMNSDGTTDILMHRRGRVELYSNQIQPLVKSRTFTLSGYEASDVRVTAYSKDTATSVLGSVVHGFGMQGSTKITVPNVDVVDSIEVCYTTMQGTMCDRFIAPPTSSILNNGGGSATSSAVAVGYAVRASKGDMLSITAQQTCENLKVSIYTLDGKLIIDKDLQAVAGVATALNIADVKPMLATSGLFVVLSCSSQVVYSSVIPSF